MLPPAGAGWSAPTRPRARPGFRRSDIPPRCGSCRRARPSCRPLARRRRRYCCRRTPRRSAASRSLAEVGAGLLDQFEQFFGLGVSGLGGRPKPPWTSISTSCSAATARHRPRRPRARALPRPRASRAQVDAQDGKVGDDVVRAAALDPRRIDLEPAALRASSSRNARSAAASKALRPSSGLRPAWAERPRTTKEKLPLPGRAPASVPSGKRAGS